MCNVWHRRMSPRNLDAVHKLDRLAKDLKIKLHIYKSKCPCSLKAKGISPSFSDLSFQRKKSLELVHSNICNYLRKKQVNIVFYSWLLKIYFLLFEQKERQYYTKLKKKSNNLGGKQRGIAGEHMGEDMEKYPKEQRIVCRPQSPYR